VRVGKGYVEACPKGINKGVMAERAIDVANAALARDAHGGVSGTVDFVLCIGDDSSDELMFQALHSKFGQRPTDVSLFTVTVGRKPSEASSYLGDHTEVVELLKMLSSIGAAKKKGFASMGVRAVDCTGLHLIAPRWGARPARAASAGRHHHSLSLSLSLDPRSFLC
jgi:trehalose 6-phosphate synthase/phosphatase